MSDLCDRHEMNPKNSIGDQQNQELRAELEQYKQENAELQARLAGQDALPPKLASPAGGPVHENLAEDEPVSFTTYNKLREQYDVAYQSLKVTHRYLEEYKTKYRKAKDLVRPWKDYAQRCEERLRAKQAGLSTPEPDHLELPEGWPTAGTSTVPSSRPSSAGLDALVRKTKVPHSRSSSATTVPDHKERTPVPRSASKLRSNVGVEDACTRSGQADLPKEVPPPLDEEPDLPLEPLEDRDHFVPVTGEVISRPTVPRAHSHLERTSSGVTEDTEELPDAEAERARSAQAMPPSREEMPPPSTVRNLKFRSNDVMEGSPQAPIHIKSEPNSSPTIPAQHGTLARMSTFDLDDAGPHIDTPRKRQRIQTFLRSNSSFSRSFPPPGAGNSFAHEEETSRPLQQISSNRRDLPRRISDEVKQSGTSRKRKHHLAEEVVSVTEDGHGLRSNLKTISPTKKMKADHTLKALLTDQTPAKRQTITPKTDPSNRKRTRDSAGGFHAVTPNSAYFERPGLIDMTEPHQPPKSIKSPRITALTSKAPAFKPPPPGPITPQTAQRRSPRKRATPLRQRRIEDLTPSDFKLNPAAHGDLNLETLDPVRTRAERANFHNCTDPNCASCGPALRDLARNIPDLTVGGELWRSTQEDLDSEGNSITEDEKILRHHLGSAFSLSAIRDMARHSAAEYDELFLTAKTHLVAERWGRHKLRPNARARSPPGYWDVDMPTTQQMEEQGLERERREREVVGERWRQAMRRGGKWIFKDE